MTNANYAAALRFNSLTRKYNALIRRFLREREWKGALIEQARPRPGMRMLDVGSGTGTLALQIKTMHPVVEIVGLDGDPAIVQIAREKAATTGATVMV
jgi:ubiquinone/menaquinone biosynthesis C-methylase UbiE